MLRYCPRCGRTYIGASYLPEEKCDICLCVMKTVPNKYYEPPSSEYKLSDEMKQKLFEELVIPSDEFDQQLFDQRDGKVQQQIDKHNRIQSQIEGKSVGKTTSVTCPYCKSTNTKKITNTSKAVHTAIFGIFSISRNSKEWHCNNCKSDF